MATKKINYDIQVQTKSLQELEQELEDINAELRKVPVGSEAFDNLAKDARKATKDLEKAQQAAEGFTDDQKFMAADGAIKVLGGSLASVVGTLGTLGIESEAFGDLERKAASAIAVAVGFKDISEGFNQLRKSTVLATIASETFGKVTKRALISTGIGALVVALGTVVAYWDDINEYVKNIGQKSLKDLNDELNESLELSQGTEAVLESQIALEKAKGTDTFETNKKLLEQLQLQLDITDELIKQKQIELADEQDQNKQLTFWEKLKAGIFQATGAYGAAAETLATGLNPESEKTRELQGEINELVTNRNNIEAKYVGLSQTVATQEEMRAGATEKVVGVTKGLVQVGQTVEEQLGTTTGLIDQNTAAYLKQKGEADLLLMQKEDQVRKEQAYQEGLYSSAQAITNLSAVLGQESAAAKALAISTAVINTYLGVTEALKQKSTLPSPFDVITKVANVATILASGFKAVQGIKSTPSRGGGGTVNTTTPPSTRRQTAVQAVPADTQELIPQTFEVSPVTRAYVLAGDVTSNQEAEAKLNTKRTIV
jgi:hypothetical protein